MSNELYHYGVKGMKWGIRKKRYEPVEKYSLQTKNGEKLTLERNQGGLLEKTLRKVSPRIREEANKTYNYKLKDSNGKTVGDYQMYKKTPDEMNITWGSVNKKSQGKGYMTAMMAQGEHIAKKYGAKKITGEVVGDSPDMLHITEKYGYRQVGEIRTRDVMDIWGGLTLIEKNI